MISYTIVARRPIIPKCAMFLALLTRPKDDSVRYRTRGPKWGQKHDKNSDYGVFDPAKPCPKYIIWFGVMPCLIDLSLCRHVRSFSKYPCRNDNDACHYTCESKNMVIFGIMGPAGDDSVRNHTQTPQSTTKHDVFMFTETLPTNECRQE